MKLDHSINKILTTGKLIYHKIPANLQFIFWPIEKIYWLFSVLRLDLWMITGKEIQSEQTLTMFYAGGYAKINKNREFFVKLVFNGSYKENFIGKSWLWQISKIVRKQRIQGSLIVTEIPTIFRGLFGQKMGFYVPCFIRLGVNNCLPLTRSVKSDLQRIKKNKLQYEVTDDPDQFKNFYYNMYLPHSSKTFGDEAVILNFDYMRDKFINNDMYNELLFIKNEKENIAGVLLGYGKKVVDLHELGIKNGDFNFIKEGAVGALFHFAIIHAKKLGYKMFNFGESRSFYTVGALQFKKKRGADVTSISDMGFLIKPLENTSSIKRFLLQNPLIYADKKTLYGAIFVEHDQSLSIEDFKRIYKDYYLNGISQLIIYRFGGECRAKDDKIPPEFSDKISICSADSLF